MSACIVTGAARGNGLAIATRLQEDGHHVIAVDRDRIPDDSAAVRLQGDVLDDGLIHSAISEAVLEEQGEVYLVNNAGVTLPGSPQLDEAWATTIDIDLTAPFRWTREYANHVARGRIRVGAVVFIGSLATVTGFPDNPAYQAAKSGVLGLTRAFAFDLGSYGIRVNCVSPGYIQTAMTERSYADPSLNEARRRHTLLGRWGRPEDVADAVAFLCSTRAAYITGVNLPVDGGWLSRGLVDR